MEKNEKAFELKVNSGTITGSLYSQIVGVTVTNVDGTLEFVYVNPKLREGQVVARITLPRKVLEELAKIIVDTCKKHASSH